jgi:hypothetical protein
MFAKGSTAIEGRLELASSGFATPVAEFTAFSAISILWTPIRETTVSEQAGRSDYVQCVLSRVA